MIKRITFAARYLHYLIKSKHYKGYGIHSPFVYNFAQEVIFSKKKPEFSEIETRIQKHKSDLSLIQIADFGAGSRVFNNKKRRISDIAKVSSTKKKYGKLLYQIVEYFDPKNILELGTSLGIGTMYLAYSRKANLYTIEGDKALHYKAKATFEYMGLGNIFPINGLFDKVLPDLLDDIAELGLVYFDGNHKKEPTLKYFELCLNKITNDSIFVFDDIHWSKEMEQAWEQIKAHSKTRVTIDLFQMGIVFFRKELSKEHFIIKY